MIRQASPRDAAAAAALLNEVVLPTTASFRHEPWGVQEMAARIGRLAASGKATFLAEREGRAVGLASYDQFRSGTGYATAMEHSVALRAEARGTGLGRALIEAVAAHAVSGGARTLWAGVSGENEAGMAFHARCGFEHVARLPGPGFKFGRPLDLVLMRRALV